MLHRMHRRNGSACVWIDQVDCLPRRVLDHRRKVGYERKHERRRSPSVELVRHFVRTGPFESVPFRPFTIWFSLLCNFLHPCRAQQWIRSHQATSTQAGRRLPRNRPIHSSLLQPLGQQSPHPQAGLDHFANPKFLARQHLLLLSRLKCVMRAWEATT